MTRTEKVVNELSSLLTHLRHEKVETEKRLVEIDAQIKAIEATIKGKGK